MSHIIDHGKSLLRRALPTPVLAVLACLLAACYLRLDFFERLERKTFDMRAREALRFSPPVSTNLGFIFIDEDSIRRVRDGSLGYRFGLYWPRQVYGRLVQELADQGAKTVAFDVIFGELRPFDALVQMPDKSFMDSDEFFALQMSRAGNVIIPITQEVTPPALFLTNALAVGDISTDKDSDGILRRVKAFRLYRNWHPAFKQMEAVPEYGVDLHRARVEPRQIVLPRSSGGDISIPLDANGNFDLADFRGDNLPPNIPRKAKPFTEQRIWHMGVMLAARELGLDLAKADIDLPRGSIVLHGASGVERTIPVDSAGRFLIDWCMPPSHPKLIRQSIQDILVQYNARTEGQTNAFDNRWSGKSIIVGSSAVGNGLTDRGATPLEPDTLLVSQHWNVASSVLTNRFVHTPSLAMDLAIIGLLGIASALLCAYFQSRTALRSSGVLALGFVLAAVCLYVRWRFLIQMVLPFATIAIVTPTALLFKRAHPLAMAKRFFSHAGFKKVQSQPNDLLLLIPKPGERPGLVAFWPEHAPDVPGPVVNAVRSYGTAPGELKLYLIYRLVAPPNQTIQDWRQQLGCEIIPIFATMLERSLAAGQYERQLREFEEPYLVRIDPYADFKPIFDPIWFYGRNDLVERLPAVLTQGQHVGIFGLRKVGKTSLANQLRQRFVATPTAFLDCQGLPPKAEYYFDTIYRELHKEMRSQKVRGLPKLSRMTQAEDFSRSITALFECWRKKRRSEPFILILDEIDKFFPEPEIKDREEILAEYIRVFRVLRSLAQSHQCLVVMVIAYRPAVNRQNVLSPKCGENPMFKSFQEHYVGFLSPDDSQALVKEIGLWKNIVWDEAAARAVFQFCGGHPLVTRYFASHACKKGSLKTISDERVAETAAELKRTLRRNEIGNYYKEAIWELLSDKERRALEHLVHDDSCAEEHIPPDLEESVSNLEGFGVISSREGRVHLTAELFKVWLQRQFIV